MQTKAVSAAALVCVCLGEAAYACELPPWASGLSPLETRRPVQGDDVRITTGFGLRRHPLLEITRMHPGVDWAAPHGTPVTAAGAGRVTFAGVKGEYGNAVLIEHGGGWQTFYSQLSRIEVGEGDCVTSGALIGAIGSTGLSTGPHLHFEVHRDGSPIDPMQVQISKVPADSEQSK
jgi:murein DD-endopeptidase MepM/ murein hydrolase activator NlpD